MIAPNVGSTHPMATKERPCAIPPIGKNTVFSNAFFTGALQVAHDRTTIRWSLPARPGYPCCLFLLAEEIKRGKVHYMHIGVVVMKDVQIAESFTCHLHGTFLA